MLSVKRDIDKPPEGWKYTIPETGAVIKADFYTVLRDRVMRHRKANNLSIPDDYEAFLQDAACRETNPPGSRCGVAAPKPRDNKPIPVLLLSHVQRFLETVWAAIVDRRFVSAEIAKERIGVCLTCPLRTTMPGGCTGCYTLLGKAEKLLTKKDAITIEPDADGYKRDVCGACGCFVPLKAWLENSTLDKAEGERRPAYWEGCWRK
jgi:hypothetical protein